MCVHKYIYIHIYIYIQRPKGGRRVNACMSTLLTAHNTATQRIADKRIPCRGCFCKSGSSTALCYRIKQTMPRIARIKVWYTMHALAATFRGHLNNYKKTTAVGKAPLQTAAGSSSGAANSTFRCNRGNQSDHPAFRSFAD